LNISTNEIRAFRNIQALNKIKENDTTIQAYGKGELILQR